LSIITADNQSVRGDSLTLTIKKITILQPHPGLVGFRIVPVSPDITGVIVLQPFQGCLVYHIKKTPEAFKSNSHSNACGRHGAWV